PNTAAALEKIPFTSDAGTIKVQGTVNGQAVPMLVDLGAGIDVLSHAVGSRAVDVTTKFVTLSLNGQRVDVPIGTVVSIALGEFKVNSSTVGIWNGLDGTGIDGLISASAFRDVTTTFDFPGHQLLIEDAVTFADRKRFATRIPLFLQDELGISLGVFARFNFGNGQSGLCVVDTGTPDIMIDRRFAAKLGVNLANSGGKRVHTPVGDGVEATIPSLGLADDADTTMQHPNVVFEDLVYDCNVGNAFWSGKTFTLDIPQRVMYVAPPA
ncbi:MAG: aspartyl protease family protein, partial [Candidatus Eremiobacteraeota bacterium]|nr:aspartyl protease family protein [Candidatus Eremiobacteraeota bacterium]